MSRPDYTAVASATPAYTPWAVHFYGRQFTVRRERRESTGAVYLEYDGGKAATNFATMLRAIERANELNCGPLVRVEERMGNCVTAVIAN